jgi:SAM-dependent methyltransferase
MTGSVDLGACGAVAVDLGCGDFRVGRHLAGQFHRYIGVDIVAPLIARNQREYGSDSVSFVHANLIDDELPNGDICFVRQVLQHLSNAQILRALPKLAAYRHVIVTEHHPSGGKCVEFNLDKPHGGDIRVACGSGVFLDKPPFNLPAERYRLLFEVPGVPAPGGRDPGMIRTYCLSDRAAAPSCARTRDHRPHRP